MKAPTDRIREVFDALMDIVFHYTDALPGTQSEAAGT